MNQKTFIKTFKDVQQKMYFLSKRLLTSHEEAADAVQEVMVRLWEKRFQLEEIRNKEAYAMQMVKNYSLDRLKSKQASHLKIVHTNYDSEERNIEDELERQGKVKLVQNMINELPEKYRMIIQLRDIQRYDFEAIEKILDMKATAVRVGLSRARKLLKEKIEEQYKTEIA
ncbi:RNA polymerase sigma-70 factor (ECF subfamily) [Nonlabens dokdonensis]|jgi:RNA polymerase sigma-70 factor (ECF subfamily)|uniref:RNA polymerase sigma-70 factor (ECF subfamily) n=2 Tax=Nonlabens dokdonensis TaxID=328515 RepID=A0ABX5PX23_9FLAO|nr:sigma-70 family RNA polymerase sigma factor [Nonlabens dokdonensis]AGC77815.1 putative DNA-directed RNA polymerase ECF-type sigma factor [Nonlabens dokdonensis DSW-6]PZX39652.1 RNA polymerase sigma-70 factor (ECF subfamily) [Nonlabens dokdonensis]